jgi:hypothetical protein
MSFSKSDKSFALKVSLLFIILIIGVIGNKTQPVLKNTNQDVIKLEKGKPSIFQTISSNQIDTPSFSRK